MADEEQKVGQENENLSDSQVGEVFLNGDSEDGTKCESPYDVESMDTLSSEHTMPRKSSFMNKDGSRRTNRKKTVSFSSMPTERKIATGK